MAGLAGGIALAFHAAPLFVVPEGPAPLPMSVSATLVRSGEVGPAAGGVLLNEVDVDPGPGGSATGRLALASETSVPVAVTLQDVGMPSGLEEQIWVRVTLSDTVVFDGTQAQLRHTPSQPFRLAPGDTAPIEITVSLPADGSSEPHGRHTEIRLRIESPRVAV